MEELSLQRIKDLIIAAHFVSDDGVLTFDTTKSVSLGFTEAEIDEANRILAAEQIPHLQDYFKSKIDFCYLNYDSYTVHYIGYAKMIFVINLDEDAYSYITEEELEQIVSETKDMIVKIEYVHANSNNDADGNQI